MAAPLTRRSGCLSSALFLVALIGAHAPRGSRRLRGTLINATRGTRSLVEAPADRRRLANYQEVAKLTAADAAANDYFGVSVAIDGTTNLVGAHYENSRRGAVYVFRTSDVGATYVEVAKLTAADAAAYDDFGVSVAIDGDTVVVGAYWDDDGGTNSGSAYVFRTTDGGGTYGQVAKLTAADTASFDRFGVSVAIDGSTVVVGAYYKNSYRGAAYVFRTSDGGVTYGQVAKLTASDASTYDYFGRSVAIDGGTVVVGAYQYNNGGSGVAYVFRTSDGGATYVEVAKRTAADASSNDLFGKSVAIEGNTVVVGAWGDGSGSAYVFRTTDGGATYDELAKLTAADAAAGDEFGFSVAIDGNTIVVGAYQRDSGGPGAAYVFRTDDGGATYVEIAKLTAADAASGDEFGYSVAIDGSTVVVGAWKDDDAGSKSGSAYVFDANAPTSQPTTSQPTFQPTTSEPTSHPTTPRPTHSRAPTPVPSTPSPTPQPSATPTPSPTPQPTIKNLMTDLRIRTAVAAWLSDAAAAETTFGHISTWETGGVTDMSRLFSSDYNAAAVKFNDDISAWDTSSVTDMREMFR